MSATRRERQRAATVDEIKQIACRLMAENGAAALSLRAISREMDMTSPALYRYFSSRDELVTTLILDAYTSLAESQEASYDAHSAEPFPDRMMALAEEYRRWALHYPELYSLIFGTPIPNYHTPTEVTRPAALRALAPIMRLMGEVHEADAIDYPQAYQRISPEFEEIWENSAAKEIYAEPREVVLLTLTRWSHLHGMVSLELYTHLQPSITDPNELYRLDMLSWLQSIGLD